MTDKMINKIPIARFPKGVRYAKEELVEEVINMTRGTGAEGGVVGLSGGIDSTTTAYLTKYAFDSYNALHPEEKALRLYGVIMPSRANDSKDEKDGIRVAELLGIERFVIPIEPLAEKFVEALGIVNDYDRGNLYSETRAVILSRISAMKNVRIMGTGNRDEDYVLGYFTKRGDGAVDNNILGMLPKRLVRELARELGAPEELVKRTPTAGLWAGQTDEGELGYDYYTAEKVQNGYDQGMSAEEIARVTRIDIKIVKDVDLRHKTSEHKRQPPIVGRVTLEYVLEQEARE